MFYKLKFANFKALKLSNMLEKKIESFPKSISLKIIRYLSKKKKEKKSFKILRIKSFKFWYFKRFPVWTKLSINNISFYDLCYYSNPEKVMIDIALNKNFRKLSDLSINFKQAKNVAIDFILNSTSVKNSFQKNLEKIGIIFSSISSAIKKNDFLLKKYFSKAVPANDNFFSALNSAIFTDGSFCYNPKKIISPVDLSTYFRINDKNTGQFERTLIILEDNSKLKYIEGCTAAKQKKNQLHAAVVEAVLFDKTVLNYSTIQNWYFDALKKNNGIFNFVTKRALCLGKQSKIFWTQIETGSSIIWKYPSTILVGFKSKSIFLSFNFIDKYQQADTGTKIVHVGQNSKSQILAKSISIGNSKSCYRGLLKICSNSYFSKGVSECDSFIASEYSNILNFPYFEVYNSFAKLNHEAKISKIEEILLFYLQQRGFSKKEAYNTIATGFYKKILFRVPFEFAKEANKLLLLKLNNALG
jgi:Fe-S cluster assembly protein SufB